MARKILEIFKDVLIVVLALAIVVLTLLALPARTITSTPWLAAILRPVAPLFGLSQSELTYTGDVVADEVHGAAQPIAITVQNTAGRMSAQYDFAALDNAFEQLGGYLAQALDSASCWPRLRAGAPRSAIRRRSARRWPRRGSTRTRRSCRTRSGSCSRSKTAAWRCISPARRAIAARPR